MSDERTPDQAAAADAAPGRARKPAPDPAFDRRMLEALVCPVTQGPLEWEPVRGELISRAAHLAFPVRDGIPVMLVSEAREI